MLKTTVTRDFRQLIYLRGYDWQVAFPLVCRLAMWVRNLRARCRGSLTSCKRSSERLPTGIMNRG